MSNNNNATMSASSAAVTSDDALREVIVSNVLAEFHDQNSPATVVTSSKILVKLLQNALKTDEKYRRVRLSNAKIQQQIVKVEGALDILGMAGFVEKHMENDQFLVYNPGQQATTGNALELYLEDDNTQEPPKETPAHALIHVICNGLENKQKELEPWIEPPKQPQQPSKPVASNAAANNNDNSSPFLSEQDRARRVAKAKAMKKAKQAERALAKQRWEEDEEKRREAKERREALLNAKVEEEAKQGLAAGITIRSTAVGGGEVSPKKVLPKPFATPVDPGSQKEQLAAAARARMARVKNSAAAPPKDDTAMDVEAPPAKIPMVEAQSKESSSDMETEEEWGNQKPSAVVVDQQPIPIRPTIVATPEWKAFLERVPRCAGAEGIRESSYFAKQGMAGDGMAVPKCLKRLFKELDGLKDSLPSDPNCSIWLRFDEETPQYIRALMAGPLPGPTPYSGGLFAFDIYVPNDYPQVSPKVQFLSTGGGSWRAGPNLYACGKVCLSLLGTWSGEKWNPQHSSMAQVLLSIQGLILGVEHPFYLEPGHGGWEGTVKDGAFQQNGQTLAGAKVQAEVGVPPEVVIFEDLIRVGTTKYGMIQPLKAACRILQDEEGSKKKDAMFRAFGEIIQAHFAQNREAVLAEVRMWMSDYAYSRNRNVIKGSLSIDQLQTLLPKLEEVLSEIPPLGDAPKPAAAKGNAMVTEEEGDLKMPARATPKPPPQEAMDSKPAPSSASKRSTSGASKTEGGNVVETKRQKMQKAASSGDYVLAGQLQEEVKRLEDLQRSIQEAATEGDFIKAGRLQAQLKALTAVDSEEPPSKKASLRSMWDQGSGDDDDMWDDSGDDDDSMDSDDDLPPGPMGPPFAMGGGPPQFGGGHVPPGLGNNVFAPPGQKHKFGSKNHSWGTGSALGNTAAAPSDQKVAAVPAAAAAPTKKKSIPPEQLCRLRIRLPNNKSVVEDFHKDDQLSVVYRRLAPMVPEEGSKKRKQKSSSVAPASASAGGAFAKPLSSAGFTLLLTRPKREFSLELHGVKSLSELNLAPSATLTIMKCQDRGVMYRGELESRIQGAQGDAMEVDGLTYEGLVELTERVGAVAPDINPEELEKNSQTMSPAAYLAELGASMEEVGEDARKCPICLGDYDGTDETESLRKLTACGHLFHSGCVETWLETKSSCPLCKTSIKPENK
ncbi:(E3-independent) E2 ubiquitin-conjugating enzyme UBE2O [Seminavis robusta]|uniref:(E3-independent) E2 ubiquitin-conjugating enzyme UBE2O n=1 Tax=Seminavis robusta TaxID=568900 RepID=A0A9N8DIF7_9STRA|nr:(E3-independent) E2 ubiquitin-conjugating enzyme UBE2O [Seminavis robusta]|eukprot:Sro160_g072110.1 (E3-independent) E2 ubiquitin-conjugating enzyme UBE2O (1176) ;mRNA; f:37365-40892